MRTEDRLITLARSRAALAAVEIAATCARIAGRKYLPRHSKTVQPKRGVKYRVFSQDDLETALAADLERLLLNYGAAVRETPR